MGTETCYLAEWQEGGKPQISPFDHTPLPSPVETVGTDGTAAFCPTYDEAKEFLHRLGVERRKKYARMLLEIGGGLQAIEEMKEGETGNG